MISFKEYLKEEFVDTIKVMYWGQTTYVDVFKNPSRKEIKEIECYDTVRAVIVDQNSVYCFGDKLLHSGVIKHFKIVKPLCVEIKLLSMSQINVEVTTTTNKQIWKDDHQTEIFIRENNYLNQMFKIQDVIFLDEMDEFGAALYV